MRSVFADTCYWIAIANPDDQLNGIARAVSESIGQVHIYTTDTILIEILNFFSRRGGKLKQLAVVMVKTIQNDANTTVIPHSKSLMNEAIELYSNRLDKQYSLVDCISMVCMKKHKLYDALTDDHHFTQESLNALLKQD
jgi:predicted nucleic acid-binding protein